MGIRLRTVAVVLASGILLFLVAGATVAFLRIELGHDYLMGLARLFDLNGEANLPSWYSSALLLSAAGVLAFTARTSARPLRGRWMLLAIVFTYLSLDESAGLHEKLNAPLRGVLHAGPYLYFPWVIVGIAFAAAVALSELRLLASLPRRTRWLFVLAGAIYVFGAAGLEIVAAPLYEQRRGSLLHAALVCAEETLEMTGVGLFLVALLQYLKAAGASMAAAFEHVAPWKICTAMLVAAALLAAAGRTEQAWYESSALLACAAAAGAIAAGAYRREDASGIYWVLLAVAFTCLSAVEASWRQALLVSRFGKTIEMAATGVAMGGLLEYLRRSRRGGGRTARAEAGGGPR